MLVLERRNVLQMLTSGALGALVAPGSGAAIAQTGSGFPPFLTPQQFGAKADGKTLDTAALNTAIARASSQGGGTVYVPAGTYLCGTVILRSRVTLYLEAGAVILGSKDVNDYTPQPGPRLNEDAGQRHLIFARDVEDVTLAGPGKIDGQGRSFWVPSGRKPLPPEQHWRDVATFDYKKLPRVSPMLELVACKRLRLEQVRLQNSSGWTMRLINCDGVLVDGISIKNPVFGPNCDGIDVTNSSNVRIANTLIGTADDAICLKSEIHNPYSPENLFTRNITVTNCILSGCCNGFKFGTSSHGGYENIVFNNSVIFNDDVDLAERIIAGIAIEIVDGGWAEGVIISNIRMQRTRTPIFLRLGNRTPNADGKAGRLKGVLLSDIHATGAILTSSIVGIPGFDVEDVTLSNIRISTDEEGKREWVSRPIPEEAGKYPEARMFGRLPAYGFYCRHARGIRMRDVVLDASAKEERPAIYCDDVKDIEIVGLRVPARNTGSPVIEMQDTTNAWIRNGRAPADAPAYVSLKGSRTAEILLSENDLRGASTPLHLDAGVNRQSATVANTNVLRKG